MRRKARTAMVGKSGKRFAHVTGCVAVVAAALGVIGPVEAQTPTERGWFSVNAVQQLNTGMFTDRVEFVQDFEEGYVESNYTVGATPGVDVMAGVRLWKYVGVGAGVTTMLQSGVATEVSARLPHPLYFGRSRTVTGVTTMDRKELRVHLFGFAAVPVSERVRVTVFGGPTMFRGEQGLVDVVEVIDSYPFNPVIAGPQSISETVQTISTVGFHVGADVTMFFTKAVGVGAMVKYTKGTFEMNAADGDKMSTEAGGVQVGGGLRLIF